MPVEMSSQLDHLFYPKKVAVVGASPTRNVRANHWISAYIKMGFQGQIYPVNPNADTILGFKSYRSVRDIPGEVDLVIFAVPFTVVLEVMQDCVDKGVKFVHLFTAGFSETGQEDQIELEMKLLEMARQGGVRLIGPNCMGIYCPETGLSWSEDFPRTPGPIGFVSQSGQLASHYVWEGGQEGLRFSKVVSYGNASDLQCHDFLNYLAQDEKTEIIGSYIEGLKDGREFFNFARDITRRKPFVVWKGGQTEGGARATQSHTASIAGSQKIWEALSKQTGIISVHSIEEMISTTVALQRQPLPRGTNVAVVGGGGGGSVTMTDMAEKEGLSVPYLSEATQRGLAEFIPISGNSIRNPLDLVFSSVYKDENEFLKLFKLLNTDPIIDAIIFLRGARHSSNMRRDLNLLTDLILKGLEVIEKPLYIVLQTNNTLEGGALREEAQEKFRDADVATFPTFSLAARVLFNLNQYYDYLSTHGY